MSETLLTVTGIASSGAGIAEYQGFRVFVPGALPGDTVRADVEPPRKGVRSAVAQNIVIEKPSAVRESHPCPALGATPACGGCPLGRISYEGQVALKEALLTDALTDAGVEAPTPLPLIRPTDEELTGFRNKAVFYPQVCDGHWLFGMFAQGSHDLVPESLACSQLAPWMPEAARRTAEALESTSLRPYDEKTLTGDVRALLMREGKSEASIESLLTIVVRELSDKVLADLKFVAGKLSELSLTGICVNVQSKPGNAVLGYETTLLAGRPAVTAQIGALKFSVRSETFLQVNTPQTARLYDTALDWAEIQSDETFLDLYCGVGTMTLLGALKARSAVGVDIVEPSIERARQNARENGIENALFHAGPVEKVLPSLMKEGLSPDVAIVDPAFKGMETSVPSLLTTLPLKRLIYVSCSPVSFARDAKRLTDLGWRIEKIGTVDLFPGALHVETVAKFIR